MHITTNVYTDYFETFQEENDLLFDGVKELVFKVFGQYKRVPFTLYCVGERKEEPKLCIFECVFDDSEKDKAMEELKKIAGLALEIITFVCVCMPVNVKHYVAAGKTLLGAEFGVLLVGEGKDYSKTELLSLSRAESVQQASEIVSYKKLIDLYNFGGLIHDKAISNS